MISNFFVSCECRDVTEEWSKLWVRLWGRPRGSKKFSFDCAYGGVFFFCSATPKKSQTSNGASPHASSSSTSGVSMETGRKCRVCDLPANATFSPCGHLVACMDCAPMLKKCFLCKVKYKEHRHISWIMKFQFFPNNNGQNFFAP